MIELLTGALLLLTLYGGLILCVTELKKVFLRKQAELFCMDLEGVRLLALQREQDLNIVLSGRGYEVFPRLSSGESPLWKYRSPLTIGAVSEWRRTLSAYGTGVMTPATLRLQYRGEECMVTISLRGKLSLKCL